MKIQVINTNTGCMRNASHAYLYAYSENFEQDFFEHEGKKVIAIKFDFPGQPVIRLYTEESFKPLNTDDHNSVTLNSGIPFKEFIEKLKDSKFTDHKIFNYTENNCTGSVIDALKMANIHLNEKSERTCKHLIACCVCPSTIVTPPELITTLKNYTRQDKNTINENTPLIKKYPIVRHLMEYDTEAQEPQEQKEITELEKKAGLSDRKALACFNCATLSCICNIHSGILAYAVSPSLHVIGGLLGGPALLTAGCCALSFFFKKQSDKVAAQIIEKRNDLENISNNKI